MPRFFTSESGTKLYQAPRTPNTGALHLDDRFSFQRVNRKSEIANRLILFLPESRFMR
jgi:hypothetical protein